MNRKSVASLPVRAQLLRRAARPVVACTALLVLLTLAACGGGGAPTTVNQQSTPPSSTANAYTGPAAANRKSVASLPVRAQLLRRAARPVVACTARLRS